MPSTNFFNELCVKITLLKCILKKNSSRGKELYFCLCIGLMHITPPVSAKGYYGSHHPSCAKCIKMASILYYSIGLMHITPPVSAKGYYGSHHPSCAKCIKMASILYFKSHDLEHGRTSSNHCEDILSMKSLAKLKDQDKLLIFHMFQIKEVCH